MFQVIFRGAHVVDPLNGRNGVFDVAVQDGKIAEVAPQITGKAETEYDFSGKVLQPGIIWQRDSLPVCICRTVVRVISSIRWHPSQTRRCTIFPFSF